MAKEILVYGPIYSYMVSDLLTQMEDAKAQDITMRVNSPGGDVNYGWGLIAKFAEHPKKKLVKVDGEASSMGFMFTCYADDVECIDVSRFIMHRASYGDYWEKSDMMNQAMWDSLNAVNAKLRKAVEAKIDVKKFEKLKGVTLDQVFSNEGRLDVELSATDAKAIGLVNRINVITPTLKAEINSNIDRIAAISGWMPQRIAAENNPEIKNPNTMTLQELKASNPVLYAEILQLGATEERDRIEACLVFIDIDKKAVLAAIESGKPFSQKQMAEFALKQNSPAALAALKAEATVTPETPEVTTPITAEQKEDAKFLAEVDGKLGLNKPA